MEELIYASAVALAREIRARHLSSEEVVVAYLRRIEEVNGQLNAVVQLPAQAARTAARVADAALTRGDLVGPLHGVPFTAKDAFDTAGVVTAAGLAARHVCPHPRWHRGGADARCRRYPAGQDELPPGGAGGDSENAVYGATNNPYDLERTPGGSSGAEPYFQL